jgi:tetratricopeptide (TPR) repeat protein
MIGNRNCQWSIGLLAVTLLCMGQSVLAEDLPVSLVSYDGQMPIPLAADDPLRESVGVLFVSPEKYAERDPETDGYATAFLVSECYVLAGTNAISALPVSQRMFGGTTTELLGLRFGIGLKPGHEPGNLSETAFRASWPVTAHAVVPQETSDKMFGMVRWSLLHLDGCEAGAKDNGKPIAFDPVTSLELQEAGLPAAARHVGVFMTDELSIVELPRCQILGQIRSLSWESTCSSWLGMMGGPVLTFDAARKTWSAVGFIPLGNLGLLLTPHNKLPSGKRTYDLYNVDEKNPRYFYYTTNVVPMAQVWPWIRDSIESSNPGLEDSGRASVAEMETDIRQSLLMLMQQRPESAWSALDYTRFAVALESLDHAQDAAKFLKTALTLDRTYAPAAFHLSRMIDWLGPQGIRDSDLETVHQTMGEAAAKHPEDPQLMLGRIYVEQKLALHNDVIEDTGKYLATAIQFRGSSANFVDRGHAYLAVGNLEMAKADFAKAYEIDGMDPDAISGLARIKLYEGDVAGGLRLAEKAARVGPDALNARVVLATAQAQSGNLDGAITTMQGACDQCRGSAVPLVYLAVLRGYRQAVTPDASNPPLLTEAEVFETYDLWPREMAEVFLGARTVESLAEFDYSGYTPDWRRSIRIGRVVFSAAYDLSQGRTIDYPAIERIMLECRDMNVAHLAPILKDWSARVAAAKP